MKIVTPALLLLALVSLTACKPASGPNPREAQVEAHLVRIEGHLARIEEALVKQAEANLATQAAQTAQAVQAAEAAAAAPAEPQEISVYIYGEALSDDTKGEMIVKEGSTLLTVLASSGVYGEFKPKDVTIARPKQPDVVLDREDQWKAFIVEMGDVITVRSSVF